jgi:hypothetical protein
VTHRGPDEGGDIGNHTLPKWFATKGPRPYFVAEHWSLFLAGVTALIVAANTILTLPGINPTTEKWINAVLAWVAAIGLILKDYQSNVVKVAAWREQVRAEEAEKALGEEARERQPTPEEELPYRQQHAADEGAKPIQSAHDQGELPLHLPHVSHVDQQATPTTAEQEDDRGTV